MLGHIHEWFSLDLVGIQPRPDSLAFKTFDIRPTPGDDVTSATGSHASSYGVINVAWDETEDAFNLHVDIPANTNAYVHFPANRKSITEGGKAIEIVPGISRVAESGNYQIYKVPSGTYRFLAKD